MGREESFWETAAVYTEDDREFRCERYDAYNREYAFFIHQWMIDQLEKEITINPNRCPDSLEFDEAAMEKILVPPGPLPPPLPPEENKYIKRWYAEAKHERQFREFIGNVMMGWLFIGLTIAFAPIIFLAGGIAAIGRIFDRK